MNRFWLCLVALGVSACTPPLAPAAKADPNLPQWKTSNSMGCMMVRKCKDETQPIRSWKDLGKEYSKYEYELNTIFAATNKIGIEVYLAGDKYFTPKTRGLYDVKRNNLFLNKKYLDDSDMIMGLIRHEGWHAVQDCMAGSITNGMTAIVWPKGKVPDIVMEGVKNDYAHAPISIPYEAEARWASYSNWETADGLKACANPNVKMWEKYPPIPSTKQWLIKQGYIR
jgi:hypothetical protein